MMLPLFVLVLTLTLRSISANDPFENEGGTEKTLLKTHWYSTIFSRRAYFVYEKQCDSPDYHIQIDHLTIQTYSHKPTDAETRWILEMKDTKKSKKVYKSISSVDLPWSLAKAVNSFKLPTQSNHAACSPFVLNTSSIYIKIQCQNKWYDCPLEYRIETQCVRHLNIPERQTWDVRIDHSEPTSGERPAFNLIFNSTENRIQIKNGVRTRRGDYPSFVYAVYYVPIHHDRNDSWLFTIKALQFREKPGTLLKRSIKMVFGFMTDKFPMDYTGEMEWNTSSQAHSTGMFWKKSYSAHHHNDDESRSGCGTSTDEDGHYSAVVGLNNVARGDQIRIDVSKVSDDDNGQTRTTITVWKNNEATDIAGWDLPEPVPKKLFPVVGFKRNGTITVQRVE